MKKYLVCCLLIILSTGAFAQNLYLDREQKKNLILKIGYIGKLFCEDILLLKQHSYIDGIYLITCRFPAGEIYVIRWIPDSDEFELDCSGTYDRDGCMQMERIAKSLRKK